MSSFYNQTSLKITSSLLGKRQSPLGLDLQQVLLSQFHIKNLASHTFTSQESNQKSFYSDGELQQLEQEELVFGKISDSFERDFQKAKEYSADLRFAPAGPRPPVPPVGGQATINDAADTIKNN